MGGVRYTSTQHMLINCYLFCFFVKCFMLLDILLLKCDCIMFNIMLLNVILFMVYGLDGMVSMVSW
ncbi:hypothetical protein HanIR_Chr05g0242571 [Helianthus annuus]|nr:hypothetical protein HanIR_Chr05g0242571 [Helianthus annuus]